MPLRDMPEEQWNFLMYQEPTKVKALGMNMTYEGLIPRVKRMFLNPEKAPGQKHAREFAERIGTFQACPDCGGTRLNAAARSARVLGVTLPEALGWQISDLAVWVEALRDSPTATAPAPSSPRWPTCSARWWRWASATCRSTGSRAPCRAARHSA
ncbi:hypothetical protein [Tessaracoccus coleopterorum]|uniref:hypothetical protein n=1 Tax=Tessaracoccus coleopterorum TaxID=2714950 RepID=UPI001E4A7332|nr:hypothetical protein [Tessaracoccus coleopterorum]